MTTTDLQKKIAEILGVSSSEKELAFEIFILKVCDFLTDNVTLKVQRVGFFQLKQGFSRATAESVLFIPLSEELYRDSKNLFLTIPIPSHQNVEEETDADVFSIGVGKPIIPISENDPNNNEASYSILRKSIEERVSEILSEADQLPNFNIWEDYYKSVKYVEHEKEKDTLSDLTADLEFKEDFMAEDLTKNLLELYAGLEDENKIENKKDDNKEISLTELMEDYPAGDENVNALTESDEKEKDVTENDENVNTLTESDEKEKDVIENDENVNALTEIIENENSVEENDDIEVDKSDDFASLLDFSYMEKEENFEGIGDIINDLNNAPENDETELDTETGDNENDVDFDIQVPTRNNEKSFEIKRESKLDDVDLDAAKENDDVEPIYYLGLKNKSGDPIDWDWGDELKEEFGIEFLKEELNRDKLNEQNSFEDDDEPETLDSIFKSTRPTKPTLFEDLDKTIKKEIEVTEPHQVLEYSGTPTRYQFVDDIPGGTRNNFKGTNNSGTNDYEDEIMNDIDKGFSFGRIFLILFILFVIVTSVVVYFLVINKSDQAVKSPSVKKGTENYSLQQNPNQHQNKIDSVQLSSEDFNDFPRVATLPVKNNETGKSVEIQKPVEKQPTLPAVGNNGKTVNKDIYKNSATDTRVSKTIYFDGKSYNFQTSSWRNKAKAEQEVKRLRSRGFEAFLVEAYLPQKGGTWYRVRIGNFKSKDEAEKNLLKNNF